MKKLKWRFWSTKSKYHHWRMTRLFSKAWDQAERSMRADFSAASYRELTGLSAFIKRDNDAR